MGPGRQWGYTNSPLMMAGFTLHSIPPTLHCNHSSPAISVLLQASLLLCPATPQLVKHHASYLVFSRPSAAGCCQKHQRLHWQSPFNSVIKHFSGLTRRVPHRFQKIYLFGFWISFSRSWLPTIPAHVLPPPPIPQGHDVSFFCLQEFHLHPQLLNLPMSVPAASAPSKGSGFHFPSRFPLLFYLYLPLHRSLLLWNVHTFGHQSCLFNNY